MAILMASACAIVEGDRIVARDLVFAGPAFAAMAPDTDLGYAPAPGARRNLPPGELARMAVRHGVPPGVLQGMCVERATARLSPEELLAALSAALDRPHASIELLDWSRYPAPRGELCFPWGGLTASRKGEWIWRGYVRYGSGRRFGLWARVRISVPTRRVVAREALPAGKPIRPEQLRVDTVAAFSIGRQPAETVDQVAGRAARRSIPAETAIWQNLLEAPREIHSGDAVTVEVSSGQAQLTLAGRAGGPGRRGELIPVRNPQTGKVFRARVLGAGRVAVAVAPAGGPAAPGEKQ